MSESEKEMNVTKRIKQCHFSNENPSESIMYEWCHATRLMWNSVLINTFEHKLDFNLSWNEKHIETKTL